MFLHLSISVIFSDENIYFIFMLLNGFKYFVDFDKILNPKRFLLKMNIKYFIKINFQNKSKEIFHLAQIIFKKHNTSFDFNFVNLIISA